MAQQADLTIDQGSYRPIVVALQSDYLDVLSNYTGCGLMVRSNKNDNTVLADLGQYATIQVADETVTLAVPANVSSGFLWRIGLYDWELTHSDPAKTVRILQGTIKIDAEVTR